MTFYDWRLSMDKTILGTAYPQITELNLLSKT